MHGQSYADHQPDGGPGAPVETFTLEPGDVLYMPRGVVHDASSEQAASLHLTIGILPVLWSSVLTDAVNTLAREDVRFRRALPPGFAGDPRLREQAQRTVIELLETLAMEASPTALVERASQRAVLGRQPELRGHLLDLESLRSVQPTTSVRRRDRLDCTLRTDGEHVQLEFHGKQIRLPAYVRDELRFVLETPGPFSVAQLPGTLDEAGRSVLVKTLIREGLLTVG